MDTYFKCDYCRDYVFEDSDFIECDCGLKWCSTHCARLNGYLNCKTSSTCDYCRDDSPGSLNNYLLPMLKKGDYYPIHMSDDPRFRMVRPR